jgi:hypothetical protein
MTSEIGSNKNKQLNNAKRDKQDEFYTQLSDIEKELKHYKDHFKGKVVFCNCDDPQESNFVGYFYLNFKHLGLKKLISTHYDSKKPTYKLEYDGVEFKESPLKENGDFRSLECIELLKEVDVVITNPPFSLFREYVAQLVEYEKKFLIIGNQNAITYKEIFPILKENKIWLGCSIHSGDREFRVPDHYVIHSPSKRVDENGVQYVRVVGIRWFTNLDYKERHEDLILYKKYTPEEYPKYDNYDAINVDKTKDIPCDYFGVMGVPITFMDKYNPDQFDIIGRMTTTKIDEFNLGYPYVNGKKIYARVLIKRKVQ